MPREPQVLVRDKETGHEYLVSESRFRRTPELWERVESTKPKTTVQKAAAKKAASTSNTPSTTPASDKKADSTQEEN